MLLQFFSEQLLEGAQAVYPYEAGEKKRRAWENKSVVLAIAGRRKMNLQYYVVLLNSREGVGGYCSKI